MRSRNRSRPVRIDGDVAFVQMACGKVATIDADMAHEVGGWNWCLNGGYPDNRIIGPLHYIIIPRRVGFIVDHRSRDKLDNRRSNLRYATHQQNSFNRASERGVTSQYKGVCKRRNRWIALISVDRKQRYIGSFITEVDAAKAYDEVARTQHSGFMYLNFPEA